MKPALLLCALLSTLSLTLAVRQKVIKYASLSILWRKIHVMAYKVVLMFGIRLGTEWLTGEPFLNCLWLGGLKSGLARSDRWATSQLDTRSTRHTVISSHGQLVTGQLVTCPFFYKVNSSHGQLVTQSTRHKLTVWRVQKSGTNLIHLKKIAWFHGRVFKMCHISQTMHRSSHKWREAVFCEII